MLLRVGWPHFDAIDRARRQAEVAAGAEICDDGVHAFASTDDGIDRTGLDALDAADAGFLKNERDARWLLFAMGGIERLGRAAQQFGQCANGVVTAGWALIDVSLATRNRLGIGSTTGKLALRALGLW